MTTDQQSTVAERLHHFASLLAPLSSAHACRAGAEKIERMQSLLEQVVPFLEAAPTIDFDEDRPRSWTAIMAARVRAEIADA